MRVWYPIGVSELDDKRLLGEHVEIHTIWSVIVNEKKGYANHPEVNRWRGYLEALFQRHADNICEMRKRRMKHKSPLLTQDTDLRVFSMHPEVIWPDTIEPLGDMIRKLEEKQGKKGDKL